MLKYTLSLAAVVCLFTAQSASATIHVYDFVMDGAQETPPVATPGAGSCNVTLDDITFNYSVNCTFQDLIGTANNAHIHGPAPAGTPAGVLVPLSFTPSTSGTITGAGTLSALNAQRMLDGLTYVNLHSTFRPGGELRGQIVPEPATALLLGLGALVAIRRRR